MVDVWMHGFPVPGAIQALGIQIEQWGFDGLLLADSQNLVGDPFVELGMLARATTDLGLGTGIINPRTRHSAVVAAAIATVQIESSGRAVLGVGRGDSALAQIGLEGTTTSELRGFLDDVTRYLSGEDVHHDGHVSRLGWLPAGFIPPPVELAATGERTIALGASAVDRVALTLGADPARLALAITGARNARTAAGRDPGELKISAYLNIACHPDTDVARQLVRGSTAIFTRFSGSRADRSHLTDATERVTTVIDRVKQQYVPAHHGLSTRAQSGAMGSDFIDSFAIAGSADHCTRRLAAIAGLGVDRLILVPGSRDSDPALLHRSNEALAHEVLPALRTAVAAAG